MSGLVWMEKESWARHMSLPTVVVPTVPAYVANLRRYRCRRGRGLTAAGIRFVCFPMPAMSVCATSAAFRCRHAANHPTGLESLAT